MERTRAISMRRESQNTVFQHDVLDYLADSQLSEQEDEPDTLRECDGTEQEANVEMDLTYLGILDTTDDLALKVLYWVYGTCSTLKEVNCQSIRDWAHGIMRRRGVQRPGYHALAVAGMLFVEANILSKPNNYTNEGSSEILLDTALSTSYDGNLPTTTFATTRTMYASVVHALYALQRRNRDTMTAKAADIDRWEKLRKEVVIIERCLTTLQNAAYRFSNQVKTNADMCDGYNTDLIGQFLTAWGASGVDDLVRSLRTANTGSSIDNDGSVGGYNNAEVRPSWSSGTLHTVDTGSFFLFPDMATFGESLPPPEVAALQRGYAEQWGAPAFQCCVCGSAYAVPDYTSPGTGNLHQQPVIEATDTEADEQTRRDFAPKPDEILSAWFEEHRVNPYPTREQKIKLAETTQWTYEQVRPL
ncbi:hypothetical protein LTR96_011615 [Exophiala xenobiotica]|nr:hypothetical protein LTR96_011615 [Exophiala xenobiotica]KAK5332466.1 hypothetical protein LTR98_011415 [Exophiala xenobiotica]